MAVFKSSVDADNKRRHEAFLFDGPVTDYPAWAHKLFNERALFVQDLCTIGIRASKNVIVKTADPKAGFQLIQWGEWVLVNYAFTDDGETIAEVTVVDLDTLRKDYYPVGELESEEAAEYFLKEVPETQVIVSIPTKHWAFQWQGEFSKAPTWFNNAARVGHFQLRGRTLVIGWKEEVILPGDWILYDPHNKSAMAVKDQEYQGLVKK